MHCIEVWANHDQCKFTSVDLPCEWCLKRNINACIKRPGEKAEGIKLGRLPPTSNDSVIVPQDVLLLQFAYSDEFSSVGGAFIGNLFRKFPPVFGVSIDSDSLRHATLAWAAAFIAPKLSFWDRMEAHSLAAIKALNSKSYSDNFDMADLYASLLLAFLSCIYRNGLLFTKHVIEAMGIMLNSKAMHSARNHARLSIFLPLARDLILEASRTLLQSNELVLHFFDVCQKTIGPPDFDHRVEYCQELVCVSEQRCYTFYHSIWHHTTILRRCLRDTVWRQFTDTGLTPYTRSVLKGVKNDLQSANVQAVVAQLTVLKSNPAQEDGEPHIAHGEWMFALLLYHFCKLMTTLLEAETLIQGLSSVEAVSHASELLLFVDHTWLQDDPCLPCNLGVPSNLRKAVVVRVLLLIGLTMNLGQFSDGKLPYPCIWTNSTV